MTKKKMITINDVPAGVKLVSCIDGGSATLYLVPEELHNRIVERAGGHPYDAYSDIYEDGESEDLLEEVRKCKTLVPDAQFSEY